MEGDGEEYTFNIVNQEKANSQYNFGKLKVYPNKYTTKPQIIKIFHLNFRHAAPASLCEGERK